MAAQIPADHDEVVELSPRAWSPVYASMADLLVAELATPLHGEDWRVVPGAGCA